MSMKLKILFPLLFGAMGWGGIYQQLDLRSLSEQLAFCELYPEAPERREVERRLAFLVGGDLSLEELIPLVNLTPGSRGCSLSKEQVAYVEQLCSSLPNRKLRGYACVSEAEVLALPEEEVDLGKALLLSQLREDQAAVGAYSALLDLLALRLLISTSFKASPLEKIRAINHLLFEEMHLRFPHHALLEGHADEYTFLPSVLDRRLGVCLGVSALYLCLAQRLNLPLEILTPPGHIYLRYREGEREVNIETTAHGVHLPTEKYLTLETLSLETHTLKEVVGFTHMNQASTFLEEEDYAASRASLLRALPYLPDHPLLKTFLGFHTLFTGDQEGGRALLESVEKEGLIHSLAADFLAGRVDEEGVRVSLRSVGDEKEEILAHLERLEEVVKRCPDFRFGLAERGMLFAKLGRMREALSSLLRYDALDPHRAEIQFALAELTCERADRQRAWHFLRRAEALIPSDSPSWKILKNFRRKLDLLSPE